MLFFYPNLVSITCRSRCQCEPSSLQIFFGGEHLSTFRSVAIGCRLWRRGEHDKDGRCCMNNPRCKNGALRKKHRARMKAIGAPCGICKGRLGPIHYEEPSDSKHPLSFVIDEIRPVSRWREFGYPSPEAAAQDWNNLQPAHYCCNAMKSNKTMSELNKKNCIGSMVVRDGNW